MNAKETKNGQSLSINLTIAGKLYKLTIDRDKEELYRRAEKEINRRVSAIASQFIGDNESYLAISALQLALQVVTMENSRSMGDDLDALAELERKIDRHLNRLK